MMFSSVALFRRIGEVITASDNDVIIDQHHFIVLYRMFAITAHVNASRQ